MMADMLRELHTDKASDKDTKENAVPLGDANSPSEEQDQNSKPESKPESKGGSKPESKDDKKSSLRRTLERMLERR